MMPKNSERRKYLRDLSERMWEYRSVRFAGMQDRFDRLDFEGNMPRDGRPPVFLSQYGNDNVIRNQQKIPSGLLAETPPAIQSYKRHRWFGSMNSSQALAESVFGNLTQLGRLSALEGITRDGRVLFPADAKCSLEQEVKPFSSATDGRPTNRLGESPGRGTSIDVLFERSSPLQRVAVECKLTENGVGECSKANVEPPCYLSRHGVQYWKYIPQVFSWSSHGPTCLSCPARLTYQLMRNVLSACVNEFGQVEVDAGHRAVLVYDKRNPSFMDDGIGMSAWHTVKMALRFPNLLERCSWQEIVRYLRADDELVWLAAEIEAKYGLRPVAPD